MQVHITLCCPAHPLPWRPPERPGSAPSWRGGPAPHPAAAPPAAVPRGRAQLGMVSHGCSTLHMLPQHLLLQLPSSHPATHRLHVVRKHIQPALCHQVHAFALALRRIDGVAAASEHAAESSGGRCTTCCQREPGEFGQRQAQAIQALAAGCDAQCPTPHMLWLRPGGPTWKSGTRASTSSRPSVCSFRWRMVAAMCAAPKSGRSSRSTLVSTT